MKNSVLFTLLVFSARLVSLQVATPVNFTHISLDPNGVYIGLTANGWLWRYVPSVDSWVTVWTGEEVSAGN